MVGGTPEVGEVLGIADRRRVVVPDDIRISDAVIERLRAIHEVDAAGLAAYAGLELTGILLLDHIDVRSILTDIVMDKEFRIVIIEAVLVIVDS